MRPRLGLAWRPRSRRYWHPGVPIRAAAVREPFALASLIGRIASLAWTVYADLKKRTAKPTAEAISRTVWGSLRDQGQAATPDRVVVTETIRAASDQERAEANQDQVSPGEYARIVDLGAAGGSGSAMTHSRVVRASPTLGDEPTPLIAQPCATSSRRPWRPDEAPLNTLCNLAPRAVPQTAPISAVTRRHKSGLLNFARHSPEDDHHDAG